MTIKKEQDLAWFKQVESLSDLSICKILAELEGLQTYVQFETVRVVVADGDDYYFNPLENNDQFVDLFIKHDVQRTYEPYDFIGWTYHVLDGENPIHITERQNFVGNGKPDISMQKAGCMAIILNKANPDFQAINLDK